MAMGKFKFIVSNYLYRCSRTCTVEPGFTCTVTNNLSTCTEVCGDGKNHGYNGCDDGNTVSGDG